MLPLMFGNRLGWLLSLVVVMLTAAFLWSIDYAARRMPEAGPVGQKAASYSLALPLDPRVAATWMSDERNAAPLYMQAIAEHDANPKAFERYLATGRLNTPEHQAVEKAVRLLVDARTSKTIGGVFGERPELVITYDNRPALNSLGAVADVARKIGRQRQSAGELPKAQEIYEALYTLGIKLMEERLAYEEWHVGRNLLPVGRWLGELPDYSTQAHRFEAVENQFKIVGYQSVVPVRNLIFVLNPDPDTNPSHATWTGDMIALATRGGDPMWRIEATLALGRARFQGYSRADVVNADKTLAALEKDPDPHVQYAAKKARALTREELRRIPTVIE